MNDLLAISLASLAVATGCFLLIQSKPIRSLWQRYACLLERQFDFLFIQANAQGLAAAHMGLVVSTILLAAYITSLTLLLLSPFVALLPGMVLDSKLQTKRMLVSEQLASWLTVLANSLKSSPNISDAFASSTHLVQSPLREEVDLLVKEVQLGEHLDRAMHRSAQRLKSPLYSSVMTTLLVARKTGGDLPKILDESSGTLREMERLAGVVRSKTAEGRAQTFVLALLPFVMILALQKVDPHMIPGLAKSSSGCIILAGALSLWLASIFLARRIVKVDI